MSPSRRTPDAMQRDRPGGVPASPHPMPFPRAREGNLEPPLSTWERGGGEGLAGGVVRRGIICRGIASGCGAHLPPPACDEPFQGMASKSADSTNFTATPISVARGSVRTTSP